LFAGLSRLNLCRTTVGTSEQKKKEEEEAFCQIYMGHMGIRRKLPGGTCMQAVLR
jgi:hypothetical protein